jgi:hypothetical protein
MPFLATLDRETAWLENRPGAASGVATGGGCLGPARELRLGLEPGRSAPKLQIVVFGRALSAVPRQEA